MGMENSMQQMTPPQANMPEADKHVINKPKINQETLELYDKAKKNLQKYSDMLKSGVGDARILKQEIEKNERLIRHLAPHAGIPDREIWRDKDPFVFNEKNVRTLKELLKYWHQYKPDYIFLTETSAIPYGYAIKEAWKNAYPDEILPMFYRIESWTEDSHIVEIKQDDDIDELIKNSDIDNQDLPVLNKMREGIIKYLDDRIKKNDAKIIIFDQYDKSMEPQRLYEGNESGDTITGLAHELKKHHPEALLYYAGVNNGCNELLDFGRHAYPMEKKHPRVTLKRNVDHKKKIARLIDGDERNCVDPLAKKRLAREITQEIIEKGYFPVGKTIKDPDRRKEALEYIKNLKEVGQLAGQELYLKLEGDKK
ncbi:MAG: hypothetical protein M0P97_03550 [Candidatus Moranbacteria bacterium]|jgi:hypothetical protein|nr:hypothetical protein [Candidatus Moranbacteria bacterium]